MALEAKKACSSYLLWAENGQGKAASTLRSQNSDLKVFCAYLTQEKTSLEAVDSIFLQAFVDDLSLDHAPASVSRMISTLRAFFGWLNLFYELPDPTELLKRPRLTRHLPVWASADQMEQLIQSFDLSDKGVLDRTIVMTLYCCGLRVSELCTLRFNDVRLDQKQLKIRGKGGKERIIPLVDSCIEQMKTYLDTVRQNSGSLRDTFFVTLKGKPLNRNYVYKLVKKDAWDNGLSPAFSPHSIRHSYATKLVSEEVDLRLVQELLGHSDISTTQIYTHIDTRHLIQTVDEALPDPGFDFAWPDPQSAPDHLKDKAMDTGGNVRAKSPKREEAKKGS